MARSNHSSSSTPWPALPKNCAVAAKVQLVPALLAVDAVALGILVVLIVLSIRQKRENQPPASLGNAYFREER